MGDETVVATTKEGETVVTFDQNHPYHLNASDAPGMNLVNSVFDGRGYPEWRRSILIGLSHGC